jgi:hypothetical protein
MRSRGFFNSDKLKQKETELLSNMEPDDYQRALTWMPWVKLGFVVAIAAGVALFFAFYLGAI